MSLLLVLSPLRLDLPTFNNGGGLFLAGLVVGVLLYLLGRGMRPKGHWYCRAGHPHTSRLDADVCDGLGNPDRDEVA